MMTAQTADEIREIYGFGSNEQPRTMVERVFFEADPGGLLNLEPEQLHSALSWWLAGTLSKSARETAAGRVVSGDLLLQHWQALPESAQEVFPSHMPMTVQALADSGDVLVGRASEAAEALLSGDVHFEPAPPRGPTVTELRERAERNRATGIQRNGRLYRKPQIPTGDTQ